MNRILTVGGLIAFMITAGLAQPASADPPRHDHHDGYYGSRSDRGYGYDRGYRYDGGFARGSRYGGGGTYGGGYYGDPYYGGDAYRHNGHPAELRKWTHGDRHVIDRRHGHHR